MLRPLLLLLALVTLVLDPWSSSAQIRRLPRGSSPTKDGQSVYFLGPDTVRLTFGELRTGYHLPMSNKGADTARVRFQIRNSGEGQHQSLTRLLGLRAERLLQPGDTSLLLASAVQDGAVRAGTYAGTLQVVDASKRVRSERFVLVRVPASLPPAETTWNATIAKFSLFARQRSTRSQQAETRCAPRTREWPGRPPDVRPAPCVRDNVIPLRLVAADRAHLPSAFHHASQPVLLGVITNKDAQDQAMVWWTGSPLRSPAGLQWPGLEMDFVGVDEPGEYTGNILLPAEAGGASVRLAVRMTHHWTLVLFPIMLGVGLSMWLRNYVRKRQGILALRERRAQLSVRAERVESLLAKLDEDVEEAGRFRLDGSVLDGIRQADRRIRALARSRRAADKDETERVEIDSSLVALDSSLNGWEELVAALQRLGGLLVERDRAAVRLSEWDRPEVSPIRERAATALEFVELSTDDAVESHCSRVEQASDLVERWSALAREAARLQAVGSDTEMEGAARELQGAQDVRALEAVDKSLRQIAARMQSPRPRHLLRLRSRRLASDGANTDDHGLVAPGAMDDPSGERNGAWSYHTAASRLTKLVSGTPAERVARRAWLARWSSEIAAGLLAFGVASVTALSELYTTKTYFGTLDDYVLAVLWGFGTKLGLDAVRSGLGTGVAWPFRRNPGGPSPAGGAG